MSTTALKKSQDVGYFRARAKEHRVVSEFTAQKNGRAGSTQDQSDYGVSLTGVAGPDSLEGHPAGTVFIGLAQPPKGTEVIKANIAGRSRADVDIMQSCMPLT